MRLAFAGTPAFAVPALEALAAGPHRLVAVFTQPDRPKGRGLAAAPGAVKRRAQELDLPVHQPATFKSAEAQQMLEGLGVDAFVVAAYGLILPPAALGIPAHGCLNIHASLLPRWRGAAPIQRALLAGDSESGITIMRMEAGLDTGPMLSRRVIGLAADETGESLHDRLATLGAELIGDTLDRLAAGEIEAIAQPASGVTYAPKIDKREAQIDWCRDALSLGRQVRAFNPWPVAETRWQGEQLRIWEALAVATAEAATPGTVIGATPQGIDVACGIGTLRIRRLQRAGRKPQPAREFINAHALTGARFAAP